MEDVRESPIPPFAPRGAGQKFQRRTGTALAIRCAIVALGGLLAVVLLVQGNLLIGGLIGALAVLRAMALAGAFRRRRRIQAWRDQRTSGGIDRF
jgi:hypothetical protein